jgi:hypothetical protein
MITFPAWRLCDDGLVSIEISFQLLSGHKLVLNYTSSRTTRVERVKHKREASTIGDHTLQAANHQQQIEGSKHPRGLLD